MSITIGVSHITRTSAIFYFDNDGAGAGAQDFKIYASDGTTVVKTISSSDAGWDASDITVTGLTPGTSYIAKLDDDPTSTASFTTLTDDPKVATESMWADLASRVKAKSDVAITMTTTDPGEGSALAADHYVGVYGGDPIIMDYSTSEVNTGAKWIDGSAIYKKTVDLGAMPNTTTKNVSHGISNLGTVIKVEGAAVNSSGNTILLPTVATSVGYNITVQINSTDVKLEDGADRSGYSGHVTIYYTKSS